MYFNESHQEAKEAVGKVLDKYVRDHVSTQIGYPLNIHDANTCHKLHLYLGQDSKSGC